MKTQTQFTLDIHTPQLPGPAALGPARWVYPEICDLYQNTDPEVWAEGVELFQEGVGFYRFYSLAELQAAALPDTRLMLPERGEWVGGK